MKDELLPVHLRENASYLQCNKCKRKTTGGELINATCVMPQPDGERCMGIMEGISQHYIKKSDILAKREEIIKIIYNCDAGWEAESADKILSLLGE